METILNKTKFHKVFALLMAMIFALSFSLTGVHAIETNDTVNVKVQVEDGDQVEIYKIIDVNYDATADQPKDPMYKWNEKVATWINNSNNQEYKNYVGTDNAVSESFKADQSNKEAFKEFLQKLAAALKTNEITGILPTTGTNASLSMGEYLIVGTSNQSTKFYSPTTIVVVPEYEGNAWKLVAKANDKVLTTNGNNTYNVNLKSTTLTFTKSVKAESEEATKNMKTVGVGDQVDYVLKAMVPVYPADAKNKTFKIEDTAGQGLTLPATDEVKVYSDEASNTELTQGVTKNVEGQKITINFDYDALVKQSVNTVYVKYSATVNGNAPVENALVNTAKLIFARDPYQENQNGEILATETVYTYALDITKVGEDKNQTLTGAQFTLKKGKDSTELNFVKATDGSYTLAAAATQNATTTLEVDTNGKLVLKGLDTGEYVLTETKAANGMVLPKDPTIAVTLKDAEPNGELDDNETTLKSNSNIVPGDSVEISKNTLKFKVVNSNKANFELPNTGGTGTLMFTVGGILLMAGAVIYLIITRKKA